MDIKKIGWNSLGLIGLAQDREKWRATVNEVIKLQIYKIGKILD
jgi:hypothetical protein